MIRVVAFTFDADIHCRDCTEKYIADAYTHGVIEDVSADFDCYADSENNPIHPLFSTDEYDLPLVCGDCLEVIEN